MEGSGTGEAEEVALKVEAAPLTLASPVVSSGSSNLCGCFGDWGRNTGRSWEGRRLVDEQGLGDGRGEALHEQSDLMSPGGVLVPSHLWSARECMYHCVQYSTVGKVFHQGGLVDGV